jgi:hypothetical protein
MKKNIFDFILDSAKKTKTFGDLTKELNNNGYSTDRGGKYKGGRGTAKLVRSAFDAFRNRGDDENAEKISKGFTNAKGEYAYKKKK